MTVSYIDHLRPAIDKFNRDVKELDHLLSFHERYGKGGSGQGSGLYQMNRRCATLEKRFQEIRRLAYEFKARQEAIKKYPTPCLISNFQEVYK